jgi:prepilin-type N-terminal cleavage/methylation domain-containing protein
MMDDLYNRVARRQRGGEQGFTLIELLVVITVLAILGAIVIFNVTGVANKGRAAACSTEVAAVQAAVDQAINDNGGENLPASFPVSSGDMGSGGNDLKWLNTQGYLHTVPQSCSPFTITPNPVVRAGVTVNVYNVTGTAKAS